MKRLSCILYLFCLCFPITEIGAQTAIPLESWRTHFSYQGVYALGVAGERVYAAGRNGLFYYDLQENTTVTLSTMEGLSDAGVSKLAYHQSTESLLIAYRNGNIDILQDGEIYNFPAIRQASIPGSRSINHILFRNNTAYLATDYGISLLDLQARQLQESYYNLGPGGQRIPVNSLTVWNDSLFAATADGIMANALQGANLSDYSSWKRYSLPASFEGAVSSIATTDDGLFAGLSGEGLYRYQAGNWNSTSFITQQSFRSLQAVGNELLISLDQAVFQFQPDTENSEPLAASQARDPFEAVADEQENIWIADGAAGLLSDFEGDFRSYIPRGPLADIPVRIRELNNEIWALYGRFREGAYEQTSVSGFSRFVAGNWHNYQSGEGVMPQVRDFTDIAYSVANQKYYLSSYTDGLLEWDPATNEFRQFTAGLAWGTLQQAPDGSTPITTLATDSEGQVWMVQPLPGSPLHRYNPAEDEWTSFLHNNSLASGALQLLILANNDKWLRLSGTNGILVFNEEESQSRRLSDAGNQGGLSNRRVTELLRDLDEQVWVGLEQGVNYIVNAYSVLQNNPINAVLPVYERRALLNTETVTALGVDGGNRKWIGTPNGLWVFGDYGDTLYHQFTVANSPLPNNYILDLAVEQNSGEVFIATRKGMVSYRTGASPGGFTHAETIKVFPNPVQPGYTGKVGISGLVRDAIVKITDVSGRLVKELAAEGGTASWDVTDTQGRRPATGVYLIFSASADGTETLVGKVAVIN